LILPQDEIQYYQGDSQLMLINFGDWFLRQEPPSFVDASELKIFSDNLRLMGIIDAVQFKGGKVNLIDYKTSKNAVITDDIMRQAAIYALLYQDRHNKVPHAVCNALTQLRKHMIVTTTTREGEIKRELLPPLPLIRWWQNDISK
jgi:hypothetical protein